MFMLDFAERVCHSLVGSRDASLKYLVSAANDFASESSLIMRASQENL